MIPFMSGFVFDHSKPAANDALNLGRCLVLILIFL